MTRRARGSVFVEMMIVMPIVALLLATVTYFRDSWVNVFAALHKAETDTWDVAMTNDRNRCGTNTPHEFDTVSLGRVGNESKLLAAATMTEWSFLWQNGGVRKQSTRAIPHAPAPLAAAGLGSTTRADYMPCPETVGKNDGALPVAFDALWYKFVGPQ